MIFVTVGSAEAGAEFERLIRWMDEIAPELPDEVVAQIGSVENPPLNMKWFRYVSFTEATGYFRDAAVVVGHGGTGTILNALRFARPMVIVPRRITMGELDKDDHQQELAKRLEDKDGIFVAGDREGLKAAVLEALKRGGEGTGGGAVAQGRAALLAFMKDYVRNCRLRLER